MIQCMDLKLPSSSICVDLEGGCGDTLVSRRVSKAKGWAVLSIEVMQTLWPDNCWLISINFSKAWTDPIVRVVPPSNTALPCSTTSGVEGGTAAQMGFTSGAAGKLPMTYSSWSSSAKQTKGADWSLGSAEAARPLPRGQLAVRWSPPQRRQVELEEEFLPLPSPWSCPCWYGSTSWTDVPVVAFLGPLEGFDVLVELPLKRPRPRPELRPWEPGPLHSSPPWSPWPHLLRRQTGVHHLSTSCYDGLIDLGASSHHLTIGCVTLVQPDQSWSPAWWRPGSCCALRCRGLHRWGDTILVSCQEGSQVHPSPNRPDHLQALTIGIPPLISPALTTSQIGSDLRLEPMDHLVLVPPGPQLLRLELPPMRAGRTQWPRLAMYLPSYLIVP